MNCGEVMPELTIEFCRLVHLFLNFELVLSIHFDCVICIDSHVFRHEWYLSLHAAPLILLG